MNANPADWTHIERLRDFFAKRGVTIGASVIVTAISANAIQAAPSGLTVTVATAAAGAAVVAPATATIIKTIAMTTLQKTLITATLAAASTGIYESRDASSLRTRIKRLQQQQTPLAKRVQQLTRERDEASHQLAGLHDDNERLNHWAEAARHKDLREHGWCAILQSLFARVSSRGRNELACGGGVEPGFEEKPLGPFAAILGMQF